MNKLVDAICHVSFIYVLYQTRADGEQHINLFGTGKEDLARFYIFFNPILCSAIYPTKAGFLKTQFKRGMLQSACCLLQDKVTHYALFRKIGLEEYKAVTTSCSQKYQKLAEIDAYIT